MFSIFWLLTCFMSIRLIYELITNIDIGNNYIWHQSWNIEYRGHFNAQQLYELFLRRAEKSRQEEEKWSDVTNNGVRFKHRLKNYLTKQHWRVTVLIFRRELRSGRNILQLLTIHTSIQIRPLVTTRKLIQMYVPQAQSALPNLWGPGFQAVPAIVILFQ